MAEKSSETDNDASEEAAPPPSSSKPISERLEAHRRAQQDSSNHMARVFDILERAKKNLMKLEKQRLSQMEGLKRLRSRLFRENEALRVTAAAMSGNSHSAPDATSSQEKWQSVEKAPALYPLSWKASSESLTVRKSVSKTLSLATSVAKTPSKTLSWATSLAETPSQSQSLATSEAPSPRTSSSRNLYRRKNQRYHNRSKTKMLPSNQDNVSGISERSDQSETAKDLKQRFLSNFKY